ncbi:MAG TPA: hypothetical protein VJ385_05075 [Fibrobacteria bacterium]|nr:hypothetical protein [Fibrobacteria bacterium]
MISAAWDAAREGDSVRYLARLKKYREAHFNLVFNQVPADVDPWTPRENALKLEQVAKVPGLKMLVWDSRIVDTITACCDSAKAGDHLHHDYDGALPLRLRDRIFGYYIDDEPSEGKRLARDLAWQDFLMRAQELKPGYINLLPFAPGHFAGSKRTFEAYTAYIRGVQTHPSTRITGFDYYPFVSGSRWDNGFGWNTFDERPGTQTRYFRNLEAFADGIDSGQAFWAYPLTTPHANYLQPEKGGAAAIRFMAHAPLLYGAKGLVYFTYAPPYVLDAAGMRIRMPGYPNDGIVDLAYRPTWRYGVVAGINAALERLGPILMPLRREATIHASSVDPWSREAGLPTLAGGGGAGGLTSIDAGDPGLGWYAAGIFRNPEDAKTYLLLFNKDRAASHRLKGLGIAGKGTAERFLRKDGTWKALAPRRAAASDETDFRLDLDLSGSELELVRFSR